MAGKPVVVKFAGDTSGLERSLGQINSKMSGFGSAVAKIGGVVAGAFAVSKVTDFLGASVAAARESNAIAAQTEAALKSTGGAANVTAGQIGNLANSIALKTGIDDEAIQSGENLLLTFTNVRNETGKGNDVFNQATKTMTDMSTALGQDAKSSAIQLGKALNDPIKGITTLGRAGVSFTEQQKDQIKTMVAAGDTMGAQKLILGELSKEFGGSAEAQSTAAGRMKVAFGNLQEQIGNALIPIIDKLATFATAKLLPAFERIGGMAKQVFDILFKGDFKGGPLGEDSPIVDKLFKFRDGVIELWEKAQPFVEWIEANWKPILIGLAAAFLLITSPITAVVAALVILYARFEVVRDIVQAVVDFFMNVLIPAVVAVVGAISDQFGALVGYVQANWSAIQEAIGHVVVAIQAVIDAFVAYVKFVWGIWGQSLIDIAKQIWDQIQNIVDTAIRVVRDVINFVIALINGDWGKAWDAISDIPKAALEYVKETVGNLLGVVRDIASGALREVAAVFAIAWDGIKGAAGDALGAVVGFFRDLPLNILSAVGNIITDMANLGSAIVHGLWEGIKALGGWIKDKITGFIEEHVPGWMRKILGVSSPSRVTFEIGQHVGQGFIDGILDKASRLRDAVAELTRPVVDMSKNWNLGRPINGVGPATGDWTGNNWNFKRPSVATGPAPLMRYVNGKWVPIADNPLRGSSPRGGTGFGWNGWRPGDPIPTPSITSPVSSPGDFSSSPSVPSGSRVESLLADIRDGIIELVKAEGGSAHAVSLIRSAVRAG